jgi:hypothetical protein
MGDARPLARLLLVPQWPQPAIKSVTRAWPRLELISNGRRALTRARLKYILIKDVPERVSQITL